MLKGFFSKVIEQEVTKRVNLAIAETDSTFYVAGRSASDVFKDRLDYDRQFILDQALRAWRANPIARRIVDITNDFVIGDGFDFECKNPHTRSFLREFWDHPLNRIADQLPEWSAETTRSGDLFLLYSVDPAGMCYVRAVPSEQIKEIHTPPNDYRQELLYIPQDVLIDPWPAWDPNNPYQVNFMQHFPVNRPVGCTFGESDFAPILKWLGRMSSLLEDRVILNHLRNLIVYVVTGQFTDDAQRKKREREINLHPPKPGSILVTDQTEVWSILAPELDATDIQTDILSVKKMICASLGIPLHYLAEPESSTRTTAEAAGTPTFRRFSNRQNHFKNILNTVLLTACTVRRRVDSGITRKPVITITGDDITERDNTSVALSTARAEPILADLFDRNLIDEKQLLTILYNFLGMEFDHTSIPKGIRRNIKSVPSSTSPAGGYPSLPGITPDEESNQKEEDL